MRADDSSLKGLDELIRQAARAEMRRKTMRIPTERDAEYTAIANRFAAFFGGRPVGERFLAGYAGKPEQIARERERDEQILLYVSQLNPEPAKMGLPKSEEK